MDLKGEKYLRALEFATKAHEGAVRKGSGTPYITHPVEVAMIVNDMSGEDDLVIAALLHDVVEDAGYTVEDIRKIFGQRVAWLVDEESENKRQELRACDTWDIRKKETIEHLRNASLDVKIIALADKLSNLRATMTDYNRIGDEVWNKFNQKNKKKHEWYHRSVVEATKELSDTPQWKEYSELCDKIFT